MRISDWSSDVCSSDLVVPNLTWSNIAREVLMDAGAPATITALSTVMACSTSMIGAIEAAGMINGTSRRLALVGGVESMSRSEEHTSELQSLMRISYAVFCLKKQKNRKPTREHT